MSLRMSVNVSKCSGWDRRVNELGDNEQGHYRKPFRVGGYNGHSCLRCGLFERIKQSLGDLQITPACTDFDVRFGDAVEITSAGYQ